MPHYDLSLEELREFLPDVRESADFDEFWDQTIAQARAAGGSVVIEPSDASLPHVDIFDVTFPGFAGQPVKAWLARPAGVEGDLPVIVHYAGYGGGRGLAIEHTFWAAAGFAYLVMDTRGQGSAGGNGGATDDVDATGPAYPGFMTRGVDSPADYYYRRVFTDAVRAVDAVRSLDGIDSARVAVHGASQGGGIALAVVALAGDIAAACIDVPFLCHFERAITMTADRPYGEIVGYLAIHRGKEDAVLTTLSYFDGVNFAKRGTAPSLWSVALMDTICPPSTTYAAYNWYGNKAWGADAAAMEKNMVVYPFNGHEGGDGHQVVKQLGFLRQRLA